MNLTERIKYHMQLRGWSEYRLAKEAGLSNQPFQIFLNEIHCLLFRLWKSYARHSEFP